MTLEAEHARSRVRAMRQHAGIRWRVSSTRLEYLPASCYLRVGEGRARFPLDSEPIVEGDSALGLVRGKAARWVST